MRLFLDRGESLTGWTEEGFIPVPETTKKINPPGDCLEIALINNMPDGAVEDTESQFCGLLSAATNGMPVHVRFYTLPHVPRGERLKRYLSENYADFDDLFSRHFDGAIITGTEPRQPNLKQEPYWTEMADLLNWSEENTASTILSCLAAHAGVLHSDGIARSPLPDKHFGVFEYEKSSQHPLTRGAADPIRFPHSRWNDLKEEALKSAGYCVLTRSSESGVDSFVKEKKKSLFVHFQGHPEYGRQTLLKEYRRDVRRYLKQERESYPSLPRGYFDEKVTGLLDDFRTKAIAERRELTMEAFPGDEVFNTLQNGWQESAKQVYRNWLHYLVSRKTERATTSVTVRAGQY
jgi:homoserine O-succinyltransferase